MNLGDIISLISLVVALNAAFTALMLYINYREDASYRISVQKLKEHDEVLKAVTTKLIETLFRIDVKLNNTQIQCERLLQLSTLDATILDKISNGHNDLKEAVMKPYLELSLLSSTDNVRLSACRQLSQRYGDHESIAIFELVIKVETDENIKSLLAVQLRYLKKRINLRSHLN